MLFVLIGSFVALVAMFVKPLISQRIDRKRAYRY